MAYRDPAFFFETYPMDGHDLIVLPLSEAYGAAAAVNVGTLGSAANFTPYNFSLGAPGMEGKRCAKGLGGNVNSRLVCADTICEPANAITVAAWVRFNSIPTATYNPRIITKPAKANWASPYSSVGLMEMYVTNDKSIYPTLNTTNGWKSIPATFYTYQLPVHHWMHVAMTYDSVNDQNIRWYWNGVQVGSTGHTGILAQSPMSIVPAGRSAVCGTGPRALTATMPGFETFALLT